MDAANELNLEEILLSSEKAEVLSEEGKDEEEKHTILEKADETLQVKK
jgi:hypothetical protein